MRVLGLVVFVLFLFGVTWRIVSKWRGRRATAHELAPGSLVLVHTPDQKTLVATVSSRGASHFWIELLPDNTRFWVPATAVEPAPERTPVPTLGRDVTLERNVAQSGTFKSMPRPELRRGLDSEI
jgi:hypothetical protein